MLLIIVYPFISIYKLYFNRKISAIKRLKVLHFDCQFFTKRNHFNDQHTLTQLTGHTLQFTEYSCSNQGQNYFNYRIWRQVNYPPPSPSSFNPIKAEGGVCLFALALSFVTLSPSFMTKDTDLKTIFLKSLWKMSVEFLTFFGHSFKPSLSPKL